MKPNALLPWMAVACSSRAVRPDPPAAPATRAPVALAPAVRAAAGVAPSRILLRPRITHALELMPRDGEVRRLILSGRPAELRGRAVRLGRGRFLRDVVFAAPTEGGRWRFVTQDGVWDADGFLGLPRRASAMQGAGRGVGRVCAARAGGVEGVPPPDAGAVIDVAFSDDALGLAVTEPGLAWVTRDGGARWSRLAIDGAALSVAADRDRRWLRTSAGAVAVDAGGHDATTDPARLPRLEALDENDNLARTAARDCELAPLDPVEVASVDGSLVVAQREEQWGLYDLRDESWTPLPTLPEGCGSDAGWLFAGRLHARCGPELYALGDDGRWSLRLRVTSCGPAVCVGSADGERVACEGRCAGNDVCGADPVWCESATGAPPAEWHAPSSGPWRPVGYVGGRLFAVEQNFDLGGLRMTLGDEAPRPLVVAAPADARRVDRYSIGVGRDGQVRMFAWGDLPANAGVLEGPPGGRFAWRALAPGDTLPEGRPNGRLQLHADHFTVTLTRDDGTLLVSRGSAGAWTTLTAAPDDPLAADVLAHSVGAPTDRVWLSLFTGAADRSAGALVLDTTHPLRSSATDSLGLPEAPSVPTPAIAWDCERPSTEERTDPWAALRTLPPIGAVGVQEGERVRLYDPAVATPGSFLGVGFATRAELATRALPAHSTDALARGEWALATLDARRATLLRVEALSGDPRFETWAIGAPSSSGPTAAVRVPGPFSHAHVVATARDGARSATLVATSAPWGVAWWLAEVRRDGSMSVAPVALASREFAGPFLLDGVAGLARITPDGRAVGGPVGASPRVLAERVRAARCSASARGELRVPITHSYAVHGAQLWISAVAHYAFDGASLCLRSIGALSSSSFLPAPPGARAQTDDDDFGSSRSPPSFALAPEGAGWVERSVYRGGFARTRCVPRAR